MKKNHRLMLIILIIGIIFLIIGYLTGDISDISFWLF